MSACTSRRLLAHLNRRHLGGRYVQAQATIQHCTFTIWDTDVVMCVFYLTDAYIKDTIWKIVKSL